MMTEEFPRIELKYNLKSMAIASSAFGAMIVFTALIAHGDIIVDGPRGIDPSEAVFLLVIFLAILAFVVYQLPQIDFRRPALVIAPEGFLYRRVTSDFIPWTSVKELTLRSIGIRAEQQCIALSLLDDLAPSLRAQVEKKRWLNGWPAGLAILVPASAFAGKSQAEVIEAMETYYRRFGRGETDPPLTSG
jgi:hypothetical protein